MLRSGSFPDLRVKVLSILSPTGRDREDHMKFKGTIRFQNRVVYLTPDLAGSRSEISLDHRTRSRGLWEAFLGLNKV